MHGRMDRQRETKAESTWRNLLYASYWVIPRGLKFICRRFGTLCVFHLPRQLRAKNEFLHIYLPIKMEQTGCSETSAYKIQTSGNYPEESIQHTEHGQSLKWGMTKIIIVFAQLLSPKRPQTLRQIRPRFRSEPKWFPRKYKAGVCSTNTLASLCELVQHFIGLFKHCFSITCYSPKSINLYYILEAKLIERKHTTIA